MEERRHIRRAKLQDAGRISELNRTVLGYDYPEDKTRARLEKILLLISDRVYVAEYDGIVVGYVHGCDYDLIYSDPMKNILAIAVDPRYQGKGVGRDLLFTIEDWAKEDGCAGIRLVSGLQREDAHRFYAHCGYASHRDQKNFVKVFRK